MDRRRQRRAMAHRAVAVELAADLHGRKHERHGGARHQVIDREPRRRGRCAERASTTRARAALERTSPSAPSRTPKPSPRRASRCPCSIARCDAVEAHVCASAARAAARCRAASRVADAEPAEHRGREPVQARLQHRPVVGAIDLARREVAPDVLHVARSARSKLRGAAREHGRVDRAGRSAADDR